MKCTQRCFAILSPAPWLQLLLALGGTLAADRMAAAAPAEAFAGRWDLTIQDANHKQLPSWLELTVDEGVWKANFVGRWGNARPLPKAIVQGNQIQFVSPKEEEDSRNDLVFDGRLVEGTLTGSAKGPNGTDWTWTGQRAPALETTSTLAWGDPKGCSTEVISRGGSLTIPQKLPVGSWKTAAWSTSPRARTSLRTPEIQQYTSVRFLPLPPVRPITAPPPASDLSLLV